LIKDLSFEARNSSPTTFTGSPRCKVIAFAP
jgi:hypothetical protein